MQVSAVPDKITISVVVLALEMQIDTMELIQTPEETREVVAESVQKAVADYKWKTLKLKTLVEVDQVPARKV